VSMAVVSQKDNRLNTTIAHVLAVTIELGENIQPNIAAHPRSIIVVIQATIFFQDGSGLQSRAAAWPYP
jgi:hypothetical protein